MAFLMIAWIYVLGLSLVFQTFVVPSSTAPAPAGMPVAPSVDPFAPPPPPNYPQYAHHMTYAPPPPMPPNSGFAQPPPPPYSYAQPSYNPQYNPAANMVIPPLPPVHNIPPVPQNAAPLGAMGPSSSGSEQEFEGDKGGSSGYSYGGNYQQVPASSVYYGPPQGSLLDAYYHRPGYHGYGYQQPRQQNDIFGSLFGALMIGEMVF